MTRHTPVNWPDTERDIFRAIEAEMGSVNRAEGPAHINSSFVARQIQEHLSKYPAMQSCGLRARRCRIAMVMGIRWGWQIRSVHSTGRIFVRPAGWTLTLPTQ